MSEVGRARFNVPLDTV